MNSQADHARRPLARARDDFYVVRRLRGEQDAPGWVLGFHAQQAVEKALKSALTNRGIEYPRTPQGTRDTTPVCAKSSTVAPTLHALWRRASYLLARQSAGTINPVSKGCASHTFD